MSWKSNAIMEWQPPGTTEWQRITDHNRSPLEISVERIERKQRMVDATLRRYTVSKKRTFSCSWEMLPTKHLTAGVSANALLTADGNAGASWIEQFHDENDNAFYLRLREGDGELLYIPRDSSGAIIDPAWPGIKVMITDFSNEVVKRGKEVDLVNMSITLEEV